ncbi:CAP domain-containing protein [Mucilaginibacter sp. AW1-3]
MKNLILLSFFSLLLSPVIAQKSLHVSDKDFRDQFLTAINTIRAKGCNCGTSYMRPVSPISWNDILTSAAEEHAKDMAKHAYFAHTSVDGRTLQDRLFAVGYNYTGFQTYTIGENIAAGQRSITEVITGWFKSVGHCKNLMNPDFREIGIAEYKYYWVQDFGGRVPLDKSKHYSGKWVLKEVK